MNSYAKFGGAARRRFSRAICEKPMGGTYVPPPAVRGLRLIDLLLDKFYNTKNNIFFYCWFME